MEMGKKTPFVTPPAKTVSISYGIQAIPFGALGATGTTVVRLTWTWSSGATNSSCITRRAIHREKYEIVREFARQCIASDFNQTASNRRKKVEMLFAHLKRILGLARLRLRGPYGVQDEFTLAATAQNLRKLANLKPLVPAKG